MNRKWPRQLELMERVGEGWLGEIYLGRDQTSPQQVYTRVLGDAALPLLAPLTAQLLFHATATHPHILPTSLPEVSGPHTFYSMQPAERGSLRTLVERSRADGERPDPLTALDLIRQAGEALAYAHAQGTPHGNLKPENVLLQPGRALLGREGFHVLLSDFGLNTLRAPAESPYLSPRQRRGEPGDVAGDLYGLGALLFFALSGEDPPLTPVPDTLQALPLEQRPLVARALGLLAPFPDVPALLEALSRPLAGAGAAPAVTLRPEQTRLVLVPGEPLVTRVRLTAQAPLSAALQVEGLPPEWVTRPPGVQLQAGQEVTLPLEFRVPRHSEARSGEREVRLRLVRGRAGAGPGPGELLAQGALVAEVRPFHAGTLSLHGPAGTVGRRARLELDLTNTGNHPQRYDVRTQVPPGGRLIGPPPASLTLAPGERTRAALDVHLPPARLRGARREVGVTARELDREGSSPGGVLHAGLTLRQRPAVPGWATAALAGALALGAWQAARPPSIGAFTAQAASSAVPTPGEPLTLSWDTAGAREVVIRELPGQALTPRGALELPASPGTTTYTLQARGWLRSAERRVTVRTRPPAPRITALSVTPPTAAYGEPVTVRWEVRDAPPGGQLQLSPLGEVPARGERRLPLTRDLTFTLTVPASEAGEARQERVRATLRPPTITRLTVTPEQARPGETVTVQWQVRGARQVRLSGLGTLPAQGRRPLTVPADARAPLRLVLRASNGQREVTAAAEVGVTLPPPVVTAFRVVPQTPVVGQPVKVFWRTSGAEGVELRWNGEQRRLPARGQFTLTATADLRELGLQAQAGGRASAERRLTLTPTPPAPAPAAPVARASAPAAPAPAARTPTPPTPSPVARTPGRTAPAPARPEQAPPVPTEPRGTAALPPGPDRVPTPPASSPPRPAPTSPAAAPPAAVPVKVLGFRSETAVPRAGAPLTVRWNVRGVQQVVLSNGAGQRIGVYPARGTATLRPRQAGAFRVVLGEPQSTRPLADLSLTVGRGEAPQSPRSVPPAPRPAPAVTVLDFRAAPAQVQAGQATTLVWRVTGTPKVFVAGLSGPNPDGSFPPAYTVLTPRLSRSVTYVLRAGEVTRTVQVPVGAAAAPPAPLSPGNEAAPSPYRALAGRWTHSLGQLNLQVTGHRVTGTLLSSDGSLPSGTLRGTLQGAPEAASFNGYLTAGERQVAVILRFTGAATFEGVYAGERRQAWCGGRGEAAPRC
ncbi:protein kinase [Deinococcus sp. NW-56]|uniref:protein kinase domain-containing protein n=1 Tax=Deinococcus sp. NW-56 TaxID=2080419 RepID=UPI000CF49BD9|nr:protein kinase [Deinococcus sp. NW-56]